MCEEQRMRGESCVGLGLGFPLMLWAAVCLHLHT